MHLNISLELYRKCNVLMAIYLFVSLDLANKKTMNQLLQKMCNHITTDEWAMLHDGTQILGIAVHA